MEDDQEEEEEVSWPRDHGILRTANHAQHFTTSFTVSSIFICYDYQRQREAGKKVNSLTEYPEAEDLLYVGPAAVVWDPG